MRKVFIILFCILSSCSMYGQTMSGRQATKKDQKLMDKSCDCARLKPIPLAERLKRFPFNKAKQIQLVSFKSSVDTVTGEYMKDSLPRMNDTVCYSKLFEVRYLTPTQLNILTDLICNYSFRFNYKLKGNIYFIGSMLQCYNPKTQFCFWTNTIMFLNL